MLRRKEVRFLLNDEQVILKNISPSLSLLDFLRLERGLCGTKEGCNEGDCGACTILVGRLVDEQLTYEAVNACIRFVPSLDGMHIITIEHLKPSDKELHPVQKALVKYHGSQCGFCTPGIAMSLYGLWLQNPFPKQEEIKIALQGNLCRCTGYAPIIRAALAISKQGDLANDFLHKQRQTIIKNLQKINEGAQVEVISEAGEFYIPKTIDDLALLYADKPKATLLAGSTDIGLWVNVEHRNISPVIFIGNIAELKEIKQGKDALIIGAGITYSQAREAFAKHFSFLADFLTNIGGTQVRNMGTIGGNIANGSPIGDMAPPLIALGASLHLQQGNKHRKILLEDFYIAYGKQDLQQSEFIKSIEIPYIKPNELVVVYKVSKRKYEDISTLCAAFKLEIKNEIITKSILAYGGMAAKPSRAKRAEKQLLDEPISQKIFDKAALVLSDDFSPINDVRASADYRMLVAQNLLKKFYLEQCS